NLPYDIDNEGLIHVVSTSIGQPSYGILLANTVASNVMHVINSGTIEADVAIYAPSSGMDGEFAEILDNAQRITNTGSGVLIGGAGNDGLYGEFGNDRLVVAGGDRAFGGDGDDRIEISDYSFRLVNGGAGFDTLVLPGGSRVMDLSAVASSLRVTSIEDIVL